MAAVTMDVSELVQQMNDNLASIHTTIAGLSTKDHEAKLDELEQKRDTLLSDLKLEFDTEKEELAAKRKQEDEEIAEQRRKEDEEREARRKKEDEELQERNDTQDAERQGKYEEETKRVEDEADEGLDGVEAEVSKLLEDGQAKLAELEEKRKEINRLIDERMSTPLPTIVPRKRARDKSAEAAAPADAPADPPADPPADAPAEAAAKEEPAPDASPDPPADAVNAVVEAKAADAPDEAAPETNGEKPEETPAADAKPDEAPADDSAENKENSKSEVSSSPSYTSDERGSNTVKANEESAAPAPEADEGEVTEEAPVPPRTDDDTNDEEKDSEEKLTTKEEEVKEQDTQADDLASGLPDAGETDPDAPKERSLGPEEDEAASVELEATKALDVEEKEIEGTPASEMGGPIAASDATPDAPEANDAEENDEEVPDYYNTTSPTFQKTDTSPVPNDKLSPAAEDGSKAYDVAEAEDLSALANEATPDEGPDWVEPAAEVTATPLENDSSADNVDSEQGTPAVVEDATATTELPANDTEVVVDADVKEPPTDESATSEIEGPKAVDLDPGLPKSETANEGGEELPAKEPTADQPADVRPKSQDLDSADDLVEDQSIGEPAIEQPTSPEPQPTKEYAASETGEELSAKALAAEAPTVEPAEDDAGSEKTSESEEQTDPATASAFVANDLAESELSIPVEPTEAGAVATEETSTDEPLPQETTIEISTAEDVILPAKPTEEAADAPVPDSAGPTEAEAAVENRPLEDPKSAPDAKELDPREAFSEGETPTDQPDEVHETMAAAVSVSLTPDEVADELSVSPAQEAPQTEVAVDENSPKDVSADAEPETDPHDQSEKSLENAVEASKDGAQVERNAPDEASFAIQSAVIADEDAEGSNKLEDDSPVVPEVATERQASPKDDGADKEDTTPVEIPDLASNHVPDKDDRDSSEEREEAQQPETIIEIAASDFPPEEAPVKAQLSTASAEPATELLPSTPAIEDEATTDIASKDTEDPLTVSVETAQENELKPVTVDDDSASAAVEEAEPSAAKPGDETKANEEALSPIRPDTLDSQLTLVEAVASPTDAKGVEQPILSPPPSESGSSTPDEESFLGARGTPGGGGSVDEASLVPEKRHDTAEASPSTGEGDQQLPISDAVLLLNNTTDDEPTGSLADSQDDPAQVEDHNGEMTMAPAGIVKDEVEPEVSVKDDVVAEPKVMADDETRSLSPDPVASPDDGLKVAGTDMADATELPPLDTPPTKVKKALGEPERQQSPDIPASEVDSPAEPKTLDDSISGQTPTQAQIDTRGLPPSTADAEDNIPESPMSSPLIESPYDLDELVPEDFTTKRPLSPLPEEEDEEQRDISNFLDDATTLVGRSKEKDDAPNRTFRGYVDEPESQAEEENEEISVNSARQQSAPSLEAATLQPSEDTVVPAKATNTAINAEQPHNADFLAAEKTRDAGDVTAERDEMASAGVGLDSSIARDKAADNASETESDSESEYERNATRVREEELWLRETYMPQSSTDNEDELATDEMDIHPALRGQNRKSKYRESFVTGLPLGSYDWSREPSEEPERRGHGQLSSEEGGAVLEAPNADVRDTDRSWTPEDTPPPAASPSRAWISDAKPGSGTPSEAWARLGGQDDGPYEERYGGLPSARLTGPGAKTSTGTPFGQSGRSEYTYDSDSDEASDWGTQEQDQHEGHRTSNGSQESRFDGYIKQRTIRIVDDEDDAPKTAVLTPRASQPTPTLAPQSARRDPEPSPLQLRHEPSFDVPIPPKSPLRSMPGNHRGTSRPQTPTRQAPELEPELDPELFIPRDVTNVPWHVRNDSVPISLRSQSTLSSTPSSPIHSALHADKHEPVIRDSWPQRPRHDSVLTDRTTASDYDAFRYDAASKANTPSRQRWSANPSTAAVNNSPGSIFQKMRNIFENQATPVQHPAGHSRANEAGSPTRTRPVSGVWVPVRQSRAYSNNSAQALVAEWEGDYGDGQGRRGGFLNEARDEIDERSALLRSGGGGLEAN